MLCGRGLSANSIAVLCVVDFLVEVYSEHDGVHRYLLLGGGAGRTTACGCSFSSSAMLAVLTLCEMEVLHVSTRIDTPGPDRSSRHQRGEARDLTS